MATAVRPNSPVARSALVSAVQGLRADFERWGYRCYRILDKSGQLVPLRLNAVQRAIDLEERRQLATIGEARILALKGRQGGVTTYQQAKNLHAIWSVPGATALTLAHDLDATSKIFAITRRAIDEFPPQLLPVLGNKETREITFPGIDSRFYTGTAGAGRTGRGLTLRRLHGSEFAFWDAPRRTLNTVSPALVPSGSVVALETTASGFDSEAHRFWRESAEGGTSYKTLFFPWWQCDAVHYRRPLMEPDELGKLEDDEQLLVSVHGLDLEQIAWRRSKMRDMGRSEFLQEYAEDPESCWLAPGGMFYDAELLKALMQLVPAAIDTHMGGALEVYQEIATVGDARGLGPVPETIVIGADVAEGVAGDRSTFSARTKLTFRPVASFQDSRIAPKEFAAVLNEWGRKLGMALLVVEKNAHGITVLRHLRDDHEYPLDRIYHRRTLDGTDDAESERIGWATTAQSKPLLLDAGRELLNAAKDGHAGVPPIAVLRDAFGVRRNDKGKIELNGKDMLVADTLAWIGRSMPEYTSFFGRA